MENTIATVCTSEKQYREILYLAMTKGLLLSGIETPVGATKDWDRWPAIGITVNSISGSVTLNGFTKDSGTVDEFVNPNVVMAMLSVLPTVAVKVGRQCFESWKMTNGVVINIPVEES